MQRWSGGAPDEAWPARGGRETMNPEPLKDTLARFTPKEAGLDRDALLFEAGRESARRNPFWKAAAAALATTQAATLLFLLPLAQPSRSQGLSVAEAKPPASSARLPDSWRPSAEKGSLLPRNGELPPLPAGETLAASKEAFTAFAADLGLRTADGRRSGLLE